MRLPVPSRQSSTTTLSGQDISCGKLRSEFFNSLGYKRTSPILKSMSAFRPKADSLRWSQGPATTFTERLSTGAANGLNRSKLGARNRRYLHLDFAPLSSEHCHMVD